ncbi:MAG: dUTP diphosphatase [Candidatus Gracilibacteria bacterium]|nr:dUTP diphosphatase [Candidatus Gracilibacteria bacterium]MDQ7023337.1 dUTP diphosphatase [Candidatus Gracilibacteria bacterium]
MKERILEMLELQDTFNSYASGKDWRKGISNKGKIINWKRCVYMELAEAIDSMSWKHWKNIDGGIDYENFKVEMIDIWHFIMSELEIYFTNEELIKLISKYTSEKSKIKLPLNWSKNDNINLDKIIKPYENLMLSSLTAKNKDELEEFLKRFFIALDAASINFDDLYKLYIGKNVLNKFRQDHGYKEGKYIKIWNGEEDNVIMQKIIENTSGFENIYNSLKEVYIKI